MNESMSAHKLEAWVLSIVDRVRSKQPVEDCQVELKSEWPENPNRAARRLAGHCNASRGDLALWVVGVDEKRGVVGASHADLPSWLGPVRKQFDGLPPDLIRDLNVPVGDDTVVALLFATDRAPFVVKNPVDGPVHREVPWRDGTSVRSAKREDLLRLLSPLQELPSVEALDVCLMCSNARRGEADTANPVKWHLNVQLYVVVNSGDRLVIPEHRCRIVFSAGPMVTDEPMEVTELGPLYIPQITRSGPEGTKTTPARILSRTVEGSPSEAIVSGAGLVVVDADCVTPAVPTSTFDEEAAYSISLGIATSERTVRIDGRLSPKRPRGQRLGEWWSDT